MLFKLNMNSIEGRFSKHVFPTPQVDNQFLNHANPPKIDHLFADFSVEDWGCVSAAF